MPTFICQMELSLYRALEIALPTSAAPKYLENCSLIGRLFRYLLTCFHGLVAGYTAQLSSNPVAMQAGMLHKLFTWSPVGRIRRSKTQPISWLGSIGTCMLKFMFN